MTTSNLDLLAMAKLLRIKLQVVLQGDLAQMQPEIGMNYIINWGTEANGGTHWVALIIDDDGDEAVFFDSFGTHYSTAVSDFLKRTPRSVTKLGFSNIILQDLASNLCGWYCLAAIVFAHRSTDPSLFGSTNDGNLRHLFSAQLLRGASLPVHLRAALFEKISY
jgi:hypothetical protein